ncbi:CSC1-like protein 2 [Nematolebias whitei]|uniref:CSC1-like protein 2 n=1 Tax=Nematolebias whitei TaxID=451745 RepID=UPI00189770CB|nr:CSC1-like protein 2 [Nematolebias whitei]
MYPVFILTVTMTVSVVQGCSSSESCSTTPTPNATSRDYCYSARIRSTVLQGLPFGGVPTVLALDFMCFLALLFVFSILRKKAWDYGRLALVNDADRVAEQRYSRLDDRDYMNFSCVSVPCEPHKQDTYRESMGSTVPSEISERYERLTSVSSSVDIDQRDYGFCSWLTAVFRIKEDEIREKCGEDAVHYLSFQRHIIGLLAIVGVLSVGIILPVNFSGNLLDNDAYNFGRTTIGNLDADNALLWLHTTFAFLYLLLTVISMRRHTSRMHYKEDDLVKRTLFVNGISKYVEENEIKQHFEQAYENCSVLEARLCYDVAKLMYLNSERKKTERSKKFFLDLQAKEHDKTMINPKPCGHLCCCIIKGCEQEEAVSYYTKLEAQLKDEYRKEREKVNKKPLGMAFITFQNESITAIILKDFNACKCQGCKCRREPKVSQFSSRLNVRNWTVSYAPDPQNVYWEHLSVGGASWWLRFFIINCVLFLLLFFLTTPAIIITTMDKFNVTKPVEYLNNPIITQFFPTLLLWSFSALLPTIVYYSAFFEAHWTRSGENRTTMHKCYTFLIFMVLLLPSLGLSSLDVFFRWLFDKKFLSDAKVRFECVFLPDNGAFFVNYVIASAFIGNANDLLRIPGLLMYMIRLCLARSAAERRNVKKHQAYEFQFGAAYGWMMCVFTVVMTYSITCPIIVPFGLMYMLLKHLADRYNMYYAYLPTKLDKKIHSGAVNQVVAAPILCLFWLLFFSTVRSGFSAATSKFTFAILIITIIICLSHVCFGHFKYLSAHNYKIDQEVDGMENGRSVRPSSATKKSLQFVSILGAGLLCGTALAITIPEGVGLLEDSWRAPSSSSDELLSLNTSEKTNSSSEEATPPRFYIGVALTFGFTFMFAVDQIGGYLSTRDQTVHTTNRVHITATLGLVIHSAADGFALGAAVATGQVTVQVIVFFAVILHKAPAAFGLVSFLMHAGLEKKHIQGHLLAFSAAAPVVAISTYFILHSSGNSAENQLSATGVGMLFSAGTFLYVATVHVLPEISNSRKEEPLSDLQELPEAESHGQRHLGLLESLTLILGVGLPVVMAFGLHDD